MGKVEPGLAFLLAQVGAHAAAKFGERLAEAGLAPPHAGILRAIKQADGLSQREIGKKLGMFPSRLVLMLDELEKLGLVERRARPDDRRSHALHLTEAGERTLDRIMRISREHQESLCAALDDAERAQLAALLRRIADEQKLVPGVHPGYRKLGSKPPG
jgi:DNA-binding MarR family transcriptional regulator